ncbi:hypothetical protein BE20_46950 [Sorangium cellulosum]|uniref:Right handed beta helix domain-containing protein n=1 Tax=Sorangium cellulosum TaxID=56 RepID=A0A150T171_SORCE|nr:hypothetical protein BE20_46950 [Sorangium cellulosum]KYF98451.1 hypothetical protein BE18_46310 [Sorangium cellulosum]
MNILRTPAITVPVALLVLGGLSTQAAASQLRVPGEYPTIQAAVDAALDGDTVHVAPGVYAESILWQGKQLALVGTGAGNTIVDPSAGPGGRCLTMVQVPSPSRVQGITCRNGSAATGGGVLIQGGSPTLRHSVFEANIATDGPGGGVRVEEATVVVEGCAFLDNEARGIGAGPAGGGLYLAANSHSQADVRHSVFAGNSGGMAADRVTRAIVRGTLFEDNMGGLHVDDGASVDVQLTAFRHNHTHGGLYAPFFGDVRVSDSLFEGNISELRGGGMHGRLGSAEVTRCVFRDNSALFGGGLSLVENESSVIDSWFIGNTAEERGGGGVWIAIGEALVDRCHFIDNAAATIGGGVSVESDSHTTVKNTTFRGNRAGADGGGMSAAAVLGISLESCQFSDNTAVGRGGGVSIRGFVEYARMSRSIVMRNVAGDRGGGLAIWGSQEGELLLLKNIIQRNQPDQVWIEDQQR